MTDKEDLVRELESCIPVYLRAGKNGIARKNLPQAVRVAQIQCLVSRRITDLAKISHMIGLSPRSVYSLAVTEGISLKNLRVRRQTSSRRLPEVDDLIDKGETYRVMSEAAGWKTYQAAEDYVLRTGQHEQWLQNRSKRLDARKQEERHKKDLIRSIAHQTLHSVYQAASWEEKKAFDYLDGGKRRTDFDKLVVLFKEYREAQKARGKTSLRDLGKKSGLHFVHVGRILRSSGLGTLVRSVNRSNKAVLQERKRRIREATEIFCLDRPDVAHFSPEVSGVNLRNTYSEGVEFSPCLYQVKIDGYVTRVRYGLASEVFEANDAGLGIDEISELVNRRVGVVRNILEHREWLEKDLRKILKIFYPGRKGSKPYLIREDKEF